MTQETETIELQEDDIIEFNGEKIRVGSLERLDDANRILAEIQSVDDAACLVRKAEAARVYAKQAKLGLEAQNHATEIKLRAQRRAGEILLEMEKAEGARGTGINQYTPEEVRSMAMTAPDIPTYSDIGIVKQEAHVWQTIASIPEPAFREFIEETKSEEKELSTAATYREAKRVLSKSEVSPTPQPKDWTEVTADVYFAQICNAIEEYDSDWLLCEDCKLYFEMLGLPYQGIYAWAKKGCEPKQVPMSEIQINFLRSKYNPPSIVHEAEVAYAA